MSGGSYAFDIPPSLSVPSIVAGKFLPMADGPTQWPKPMG